MFHPFSFIHTADLHLGAMQYGLDERRNDFSKALTHVIDAALDLKVDFLIIAGDLFDNPRPASSILTFMISQLKRLRKREIPVLAVNGSHDTSQTPETSILTPLDEAELLHFLPLYGSKGWSSEDCYVYGLFNYSSRLRLMQEFPTFLRDNPPKPEKPFNICVLHQGLEWPNVSTPYNVEIRPEELPKGFQYYASGHLHKNLILRLDADAYFVYPGATETKEVREAGEKKGFCYVRVQSENRVEIEHQEIPTRRFVSAKINCHNLNPSEITEKTLRKLKELDCEGCVIALTLEGVLPQGFRRYQVDLNSILAAKKKALHIQVLNHLYEADLARVSETTRYQPRDLHERILPYLSQFMGKSRLLTAESTFEAAAGRSRAEALWQILEAARKERANNALAVRLSDELTELSKTDPSST